MAAPDGPAVRIERREGVEVHVLAGGEGTVAEVAPAWGASCIAYRVGERPVLESVPFDVVRAKPTSYGIPILFPFPNRIRDGVFSFDAERYRVDPPQHGFVRHKAWTVVASGASSAEGAWLTCRFEAAEDAALIAQFPFPFRIEVTHRVRPSELELEAVATQSGERAMPTGFGIHPYFAVPAGGTVRVPARRRWELEQSLPTGRLLEVEGRWDLRQGASLSALALDDIYTGVVPDADGLARAAITDPERGEAIVVEFDPRDLPDVVVYTPPAPRRAVCIEPQSCPTDAFNLAARGIDAHVRRLEPGAMLRWRVVVRVEKGGRATAAV
jgi:aldose 1-epimerase